jgi:hypothetical protein
MKKFGAVMAITGALAVGGVGVSAGVADARPWHGGHGDGDWGGDGGDWNGWNGGYYAPPAAPCGAGYWVPPAVWQWVPPAAWGC